MQCVQLLLLLLSLGHGIRWRRRLVPWTTHDILNDWRLHLSQTSRLSSLSMGLECQTVRSGHLRLFLSFVYSCLYFVYSLSVMTVLTEDALTKSIV